MTSEYDKVHFEIRVVGPVSADVIEELEDLHVVSQAVDTVLRGPIQDQAALVGIINRLPSWVIELRSVRQL
jgi:hypothetical protein